MLDVLTLIQLGMVAIDHVRFAALLGIYMCYGLC